MLCQCGCGQKTNVAPTNRANRGWIKGEPKRYAKYHNRRTGNSKKYLARNGVRIHRSVAERKIGRKLTSKDVVHHINENKQDNRPENLQVTTRRVHGEIHHPANSKTRQEKTCLRCKNKFIPMAFSYGRYRFLSLKGWEVIRFCSRRCSAKYYYRTSSLYKKNEV